MTCGSAGSRRLISGYAGRTPRTVPEGCGPWAHPRLSGEGARVDFPQPPLTGSSPHARGGRPHPARRGPSPGLILACAGRAWALTAPFGAVTAHPRMRGEGDPIFPPESAISGSSPHARGGPEAHPAAGAGDRLIPACAGRAVTLRGGGVDLVGSSPHARGGRPARVPRGLDQGLIPACAGRARWAGRRSP